MKTNAIHGVRRDGREPASGGRFRALLLVVVGIACQATGGSFQLISTLDPAQARDEFLTRSNLMKAYRFPEYDTPITVGNRVAVIGAGNVAMDSARTALRLGAEVHLIYRRSHDEMPARNEEIHHAEEEGIILDLLANPTQIIGDERGWVHEIEVIDMELGEPDDSGRRRPVPKEGSERRIQVDAVIVSVGTKANPLLTRSTSGLELTKRGNIVADENTLETSKKGVFAGGDIVTGSATVILAMGAGKTAARSIDRYLQGQPLLTAQEKGVTTGTAQLAGVAS